MSLVAVIALVSSPSFSKSQNDLFRKNISSLYLSDKREMAYDILTKRILIENVKTVSNCQYKGELLKLAVSWSYNLQKSESDLSQLLVKVPHPQCQKASSTRELNSNLDLSITLSDLGYHRLASKVLNSAEALLAERGQNQDTLVVDFLHTKARVERNRFDFKAALSTLGKIEQQGNLSRAQSLALLIEQAQNYAFLRDQDNYKAVSNKLVSEKNINGMLSEFVLVNRLTADRLGLSAGSLSDPSVDLLQSYEKKSSLEFLHHFILSELCLFFKRNSMDDRLISCVKQFDKIKETDGLTEGDYLKIRNYFKSLSINPSAQLPDPGPLEFLTFLLRSIQPTAKKAPSKN